MFGSTKENAYAKEKDEVNLLFTSRIENLLKSPYNTPKIISLLKEISTNWQDFTTHINSGAKEINDLVAENNAVLENIQQLVMAYEDISG